MDIPVGWIILAASVVWLIVAVFAVALCAAGSGHPKPPETTEVAR